MSENTQEQTQMTEMDEKSILFYSAKSLMEIGRSLINIDRRLGEFAFFLSERTLSLGEEKGYAEEESGMTECCEQSCECEQHPETTMASKEDAEVITVDNQVTKCVGHSNTPDLQPKAPDNVQGEVQDLVNKIRSGSSNAQ